MQRDQNDDNILYINFLIRSVCNGNKQCNLFPYPKKLWALDNLKIYISEA